MNNELIALKFYSSSSLTCQASTRQEKFPSQPTSFSSFGSFLVRMVIEKSLPMIAESPTSCRAPLQPLKVDETDFLVQNIQSCAIIQNNL